MRVILQYSDALWQQLFPLHATAELMMQCTDSFV